MTRSATGWRSEAAGHTAVSGETGISRATRQRAEGRIELTVERRGDKTVAARLGESGSARIRLPREPNATAVLINTAGGLAAGDRFAVRCEVGAGADLTVTSAAAEKLYKSEGLETQIETDLQVAAGDGLDWLPQEAIVFDRARIRRSLDVGLAAEASLLAFEAVVFGRAARGERVEMGLWQDRWRVRRAGRLIYADTLALDGPVAELLARPTMANGARALATLLHVAPNAPARLDAVRAIAEQAGGTCAAGAWNGMLVARFLAPDIDTLRRDAARVITCLSGRALPRVWHL